MGRGRPPKPGTAEEKAAARRERVRNNVRALRERRKKEAALNSSTSGTDDLYVEGPDEDAGNTSGNNIDSESNSVDGGHHQDSSASASSTSSSQDQSESLFLVNRRSDAHRAFPVTIDPKEIYTTALMATVRVQFLPDSIHLPPAIDGTSKKPWESDELLWTPCAFWVTNAFAKASGQDSVLLKTSMLAIGTLLKSFEFQDTTLKIASLEMYRRCLQGIRQSLEPLVQGRSERPADTVALYLSCHAAAMYELCQTSDVKATMHHLRGVSNLLCHLCDDRDIDGQSIAWLLLQDYRLVELGLCLKYRYASYSSIARRHFEDKSRKQLVSSSRNGAGPKYESKNLFVAITDIADDIAAIMVQFDALDPASGSAEALSKLRDMLQTLDVTWHRFQVLYDQLTRKYGSAFVYPDTDAEGPAPGSLNFKTFDIAVAFCYSLMTQLYCLETSIDVITLASQIAGSRRRNSSPFSPERPFDSTDDIFSHRRLKDLRRLCRAICIQLSQCLHYFIQADKHITGASLTLFPLDAASCKLAVELQRLERDLVLAESTHGGPELVSTIKKDIASIMDAKLFCEKMQARARAFGIPGFV